MVKRVQSGGRQVCGGDHYRYAVSCRFASMRAAPGRSRNEARQRSKILPLPNMLLRSTLRSLDRLASRLGRTRSRAAHLETGALGEEEAFFYLRQLGYTIVARGYRSPRRRGDIDLIGWDADTLCFIEVKTRSRRDILPAEGKVDDEKRATLTSLAHEYLRQQKRVPAPRFRFDVTSVYLQSKGEPEIVLFKDAFPLS
jgi:putative endonuclease